MRCASATVASRPDVMAAGLLVLLLGLPGCAARTRVQAPLSADETASVVASLIEQAGAGVLFDGEVRASGRYRGRRFRVRAVARIEPEGRIYLETAGDPSFVLACDGEEIRVLFPADREWLRAPASAATVADLLGLPLAPDELGALIGGVGAPARLLREARRQGDGRLAIAGGWLAIDSASRRVARGELRGIGFSGPDARGRLLVEHPAQKLTLSLRLLGEVDGSAPSQAALFRPEPPAGFLEVTLAGYRTPLLLPQDGSDR